MAGNLPIEKSIQFRHKKIVQNLANKRLLEEVINETNQKELILFCDPTP